LRGRPHAWYFVEQDVFERMPRIFAILRARLPEAHHDLAQRHRGGLAAAPRPVPPAAVAAAIVATFAAAVAAAAAAQIISNAAQEPGQLRGTNVVAVVAAGFHTCRHHRGAQASNDHRVQPGLRLGVHTLQRRPGGRDHF
jgi:hypothetical protein